MEKICIPLDIIRNFNLSPRARIIWAELSVLPRNENGEFVVKTKEFAKQLGICDSTLRRSIKILLEQNLMEYVGLDEKRFKKFKMELCSIEDKKAPSCSASEGILEVKTSVFENISPQSQEPAIKPADSTPVSTIEPVTPPEEKKENKYKRPGDWFLEQHAIWRAANPPRYPELEEGEKLYICYRQKKPLTKEDEKNLSYFGEITAKTYEGSFKRLNGYDGFPVLNDGLIIYILLRAAIDRNVYGESMQWYVTRKLGELCGRPIQGEFPEDMMQDFKHVTEKKKEVPPTTPQV